MPAKGKRKDNPGEADRLNPPLKTRPPVTGTQTHYQVDLRKRSDTFPRATAAASHSAHTQTYHVYDHE